MEAFASRRPKIADPSLKGDEIAPLPEKEMAIFRQRE
jgi:hypothetical protein